MEKRVLSLVVGCAILWGAGLAEAQPITTPAQAAAAGRGDGQARNPTTSGAINTTNGTVYVPGYNTTAPEQTYFGGGNGNVSGPTSAKLASCGTSTSAECVAIRLMQHKSSTANPVTINPLDPLIVNARAVKSNPAPTLGATAAVFVEPPTGPACLPGSSTTGTGSVIETCESNSSMTDVTCQKPLDFEIKPWWSYTCEKSTQIVTQATCDKILQVTVDWVPNCALGENVAEVGFGWDYHYRSGHDLYGNGGAVRAKCYPAQASTVRMTLWGGDASESAFGSGANFNPPPQIAQIPTGDSIDVPTTVTSVIVGATSNIMILPGSGCSAGICSYNMSRGSKIYACASGFIGWMTEDYFGSTFNIVAQYDEGVFGYANQIMCYAAPVPEGNFGCGPGAVLSGGLCYVSSVASPYVVGVGSGSRNFTVNFVKPDFVPVATDVWVSTCAALEASASCTKVGTSCLDGPSNKTVNGAQIARACWKEKLDYECITAGGVNNCAPLMAEPLCGQNAVDDCVDWAANGTCTTFRAGYKCTKEMGPPAGVTQTGTGYDIVRDALNESACDIYRTNADCVKRSSICTVTGPKTFFGFTFSRPCWNYEDAYTCPAAAQISDCKDLITRGCTAVAGGSTCVTTLPSGACDTTSYKYECGTPISQTPTGALCESTPYCINGVCYATERPADADFGKSVAQMELARQLGQYMDEGSLQVFMGTVDTCTRRTLVNCCKGNGPAGNMTTNAAFYKAADFGSTFAGSNYVYDMIFSGNGQGIISAGLESMGVINALGTNTFQAYGITLGWGPSGFTIVAFDPWSFAIAIAIQIIVSELMSCEDSDKNTAVKKDQKICENMGTYCSSKIFGSCIERKESYCCFNSLLSKAVNIQGKKQLGITLGSPEDPNCRGLTIQEVNAIDFTRIDLSEFMASIMGRTLSTTEATTNTVTSIDNRNPCTNLLGVVDPQQAGRMDCQPTPPPSGSATEGPAASLPPVNPPHADPDPLVTALFTPNVMEIGQNFTLNTTTVYADTLTYSCTGATVSSGALPVGVYSQTSVALASAEGITTCLFTAKKGVKSTATEAVYTITKVHPTVTATVAPNPVNAGAAYTITTTTTLATSGTYVCSGVINTSGTFAMGTAVLSFVAPGSAGPSTCIFKVLGNGFEVQASVTITVNALVPTLTVSAAPEPALVGQTIVISTNTASAVQLDYTCTGSLVTQGLIPAVGIRPVTASTLAIVTSASALGGTTCSFSAKSASGGRAEQTIVMNVVAPGASLSANFTPSAVKVGVAYQLQVVASGMSAVTWSCVGPKVGGGALPAAGVTNNYTALMSELGTTVCTFVGTNAVTFETTTRTASITVSDDRPKLTLDFSSATARVGDTVLLNSTTQDAVSINYTCPAPLSRSGPMTIGLDSKSFVLISANVGTTTCMAVAANAGGVTASATDTITIKPKLPQVTASYLPNSVYVGEAYALSTSTTDAVSLSYSCTGVNAGTGTMATGGQVQNLTGNLSDVGTRTCVFTAANSIGETVSATAPMTVKIITPTITAAWTPAVLDADMATSFVTSTTSAASLTYVCTGSISSSGSIGVGNVTTPFPLSAFNVGTATCVLTATSATGTTSTATAVLRVNPVIPTITASFNPATSPVGGNSNLLATSTRAVSVTYACSGAMTNSGSLALGSSTTPFSLGVVGATTCVVTATSMTGNVATANATITVTGTVPTVTAAATPNPARDGDTVTLTGVSTDATSLSYVCTGSIAMSGSMTTPNGSVGIAVGSANVGSATCTITASGPGGTTQDSVAITVKPKLPTVTAAFTPTSVNVGVAYSLVTTTGGGATSLSYVCTGPMADSGGRAIGAVTTGGTATLGNVGTTSCTFTAANSIGELATTAKTLTVINPVIIPTVSASFSASVIRWGLTTSLIASSVNAVSMSYSCTGSWVTSGALSVPGDAMALTPPNTAVGSKSCVVTATSSTGNTATANVNLTVQPQVPTLSISARPTPPAGIIVGNGDSWQVSYLFTDTVHIKTTCGSPVGSQGAMDFYPTVPNGSTLDQPSPWSPNSTGTSTCTSTGWNSLGETVIKTFQIRQIRDRCFRC